MLFIFKISLEKNIPFSTVLIFFDSYNNCLKNRKFKKKLIIRFYHLLTEILTKLQQTDPNQVSKTFIVPSEGLINNVLIA